MSQLETNIDISQVPEIMSQSEKSINNIQTARVEAIATRNTLRNQYEQLNNEIRAIDVDPATADNFLDELEEKIIQQALKLKSLIPEGF